jgi:hypothetical protein
VGIRAGISQETANRTDIPGGPGVGVLSVVARARFELWKRLMKFELVLTS